MKLFLSFIAFLFLIVSAQAEKDIPYNYKNIQWLGRWNETAGKGKWSGWGGSQIVFKVHGTSKIVINTDVKDPDKDNFCLLAYVIDNSPTTSKRIYLTTLAETFTGERSGTIALPDTGMHTIIIHSNGYNTALWWATQKVTFKSFEIDDKGAIVFWKQGSKRLQTVGDSWMAADCDFPRQMNRSKWELYPVATGGLKVSTMDTQYDYKYSGSSATDPPMDAVIVAFGVNDYIGQITTEDFQVRLDSLVKKIRLKQPSAPIYLIQIPKNIFTGKDFGQYGDNMLNIAHKYQNVSYISTRAIEKSIGWMVDGYHLDLTSKIVMANYVDSAITAQEYSIKIRDTVITHVPVTAFDTTLVHINDTITVTVTDTLLDTVVTHIPMTTYDTTLVHINDTLTVTVTDTLNDTVVTHIPVTAFDTTFVQVNDTIVTYFPITVTVTDTLNDTVITHVPVTAFDTTFIQVNDTVVTYFPITVTVTDTLNDTVVTHIPITAFDTTLVHVNDTVVMHIPITVSDTIKIMVSDTVVTKVLVTINDTIFHHIALSVLDMQVETYVENVSGIDVKIKLYPNPAEGIVNLETSTDINRYEIFNASGLFYDGKSVNGKFTQIDLNGFISGTYVLKLFTTKGTFSGKLVIQNNNH